MGLNVWAKAHYYIGTYQPNTINSGLFGDYFSNFFIYKLLKK